MESLKIKEIDMKTVKDWLKETTSIQNLGGYEFMNQRPRIVCKDGFSVSVQASENMYCSPRRNLLSGEYYDVELGFPSESDDLIKEYAEDENELTRTVYPYVPIGVVEDLILKHGGFKVEQDEN